MTWETYVHESEILIYLISCVLSGTVPAKEKIEPENLQSLYQIAEHHYLTAIVAYALEVAGIYHELFSQAKAKAVRKQILMDSQKRILLERMENAEIWYMPLKGAVLKDYYPKLGMRQMADFDFLFDGERAEEVRTILTDMGFEAKHFGTGNHDCYYKKPVFNFEMHRTLFGLSHEHRFYDYYRNIKERLMKDEGKQYGYHFSVEDFYIYMVVHEYKHYSGGGTGLRSLVDAYVFLTKQELDMGYVETEIKKLGLDVFEKRNRDLALHLFAGTRLTEEELEMFFYILSSGTYGSMCHRVQNQMKNNNWNKMEYVFHRFFVPVSEKNENYEAFSRQYSFFYQHKIFLVALPFYRGFRALKQGRLKKEIDGIRKKTGNLW